MIELASCGLDTGIFDWLKVPLREIVAWAESVSEYQKECKRKSRKNA